MSAPSPILTGELLEPANYPDYWSYVRALCDRFYEWWESEVEPEGPTRDHEELMLTAYVVLSEALRRTGHPVGERGFTVSGDGTAKRIKNRFMVASVVADEQIEGRDLAIAEGGVRALFGD